MKKKDLLIQEVLKVIKDYTTKLTLRQIYYRLVARLIIPGNINEYKYLSRVLVDARLSGEIPFEVMEDRTRGFTEGDVEEETPEDHFSSAKRYLATCYQYFNLPSWKYQPCYIEVWLEKQALSALFGEITDRRKVILAACVGYPSLTFLYEATKRLQGIMDKSIKILYFGDFDGSGEDIYRYIQETFLDKFGIDADFEKIALNLEQIKEYDLPTMPTKKSDSRTAKHIANFGDVAVELDALEPDVLQEMINSSIQENFDEKIYQKVQREEAAKRRKVKKMIDALDLPGD